MTFQTYNVIGFNLFRFILQTLALPACLHSTSTNQENGSYLGKFTLKQIRAPAVKMTVFNQYFLIITSLILYAKTAACQLIKVQEEIFHSLSSFDHLLCCCGGSQSLDIMWLRKKMSHQGWLEEFFQSKNQFIKTTFSIGTDQRMIFDNTESDLKV